MPNSARATINAAWARSSVARLMRAAGLHGVQATPFRHHDSRRSDGGPRAGSGRPPVHRRGAGPPLGRPTAPTSADVGRLSLPRPSLRSMSGRDAPGRLGLGDAPADRAGAQGPQHGVDATPARGGRCIDSDRGCPVHQLRLRQTMPRRRRDALAWAPSAMRMTMPWP